MKILVIDDSLMDRKMVMSHIKKAGMTNEILQASNGEEGLEVLSQHYRDICLIILDWQMPQMDGMDFLRGFVRVPEVASIPVIMVTASGSDDCKDVARAINPNLAGYVVKPVKPEKLIATIKEYVK